MPSKLDQGRSSIKMDSTKWKYFLFFVFFFFDSFDIYFDWAVYEEVVKTKEGLVFGPFEQGFKDTFLIFCVIGTIIFFLEKIFIYLCIKKYPGLANGPLLDILTFFVVWAEEVPQMILNVIIVACRDEPISVFQVTKAATCIAGLFIRFIITCVIICKTKRKKEKIKCKIIKAISFVGALLSLFLSVVVFFFANFSYENGRLEFYHPRNLFRGEYANRNKYLDNVGLFVNFQARNDTSQTAFMQKDHWIKLALLTDIGTKKNASVVKLQYGTLGSNTKVLVIKTGHTSSFPDNSECYTRDTNGIIELLNSEKCQNLTCGMKYTDLILKFEFIDADPDLIMGDISYNFLTDENGRCQDDDKNVIGSLRHQLAYIKLAYDVNPNHHLHVANSKSIHFFSQKRGNVQDVREIWKTGFYKCKSGGRPYPKLDQHLSVPCV